MNFSGFGAKWIRTVPHKLRVLCEYDRCLSIFFPRYGRLTFTFSMFLLSFGHFFTSVFSGFGQDAFLQCFIRHVGCASITDFYAVFCAIWPVEFHVCHTFVLSLCHFWTSISHGLGQNALVQCFIRYACCPSRTAFCSLLCEMSG